MTNLHYQIKNYGLYIGTSRALLPFLQKLDVIYHIKKYAKNRGITDISGEKAQPWVAELCQIFRLVILVALANVKYEQIAPCMKCLISFTCVYLFFGIFIFVLEWLFVAQDALHSYRRSIAGFFVNIIEISIIFTILGKISGCQSGEWWKITYENLRGIFTFTPPLDGSCFACVGLSTAELLASVLLVLGALASVVGGILRKQVTKTKHRRTARRLSSVS